jgi:hypothetical protein
VSFGIPIAKPIDQKPNPIQHMKKILVLFLVALPFFANAQLTKGVVYLGGTITTSLQSSDYHLPASPYTFNTTTNNTLSISPSIGFILSDRFALGASLNYTSSLMKQESPPNNSTYTFLKNETNGFGIGPFGRLYFPLSSSAYFALQGSLNFFRGNTNLTTSSNISVSSSTPPNNDYYTLGLNFKPVFLFFPSPKWGVEASIGNLGYNYTRNLPDFSSTTSFGLGWGSFSLGVAYYFIKK